MSEPPWFRLIQGDHDPRAAAEVSRRVCDLVAAFIAEKGGIEELERLLNEDRGTAIHVFYGAIAFLSGYVLKEADREGVEPLDVLRDLQASFDEAAE